MITPDLIDLGDLLALLEKSNVAKFSNGELAIEFFQKGEPVVIQKASVTESNGKDDGKPINLYQSLNLRGFERG